MSGWALPADAELVALSRRRVPGAGDSAVSPVTPVEGGCWWGWVLQEGEGRGPAA